MTVHLPEGLPAVSHLQREGVAVSAGVSTIGRALRVGFLNLMPDKIAAEIQFARLLGSSGVDVELRLLRIAGHRCRHTGPSHLQAYYRTWNEIGQNRPDALIVTGAPVEILDFESVDYWEEFTGILDEVAAGGIPAMHVCWAAQAALYHYHGVRKHTLPGKRFGVFEQSLLVDGHRLLEGIPCRFPVPVSRHTDICAADLARARGLAVLAASPESGLCMVEDRRRQALCVFNHFEYDAGTLDCEYQRDLAAGRPIRPPLNCPPGAAAAPPPWRAVARRLFSNWLSALVPAMAPAQPPGDDTHASAATARSAVIAPRVPTALSRCQASSSPNRAEPSGSPSTR